MDSFQDLQGKAESEYRMVTFGFAHALLGEGVVEGISRDGDKYSNDLQKSRRNPSEISQGPLEISRLDQLRLGAPGTVSSSQSDPYCPKGN